MVIFVRVGLMFIVIMKNTLTTQSELVLFLFHGSNSFAQNGRDRYDDEEMKTTSTESPNTHHGWFKIEKKLC